MRNFLTNLVEIILFGRRKIKIIRIKSSGVYCLKFKFISQVDFGYFNVKLSNSNCGRGEKRFFSFSANDFLGRKNVRRSVHLTVWQIS